jgi:hypothetical protein
MSFRIGNNVKFINMDDSDYPQIKDVVFTIVNIKKKGKENQHEVVDNIVPGKARFSFYAKEEELRYNNVEDAEKYDLKEIIRNQNLMLDLLDLIARK